MYRFIHGGKIKHRIIHALWGIALSGVLLGAGRLSPLSSLWSTVARSVGTSLTVIDHFFPVSRVETWFVTQSDLQKKVTQTELSLREADTKMLHLAEVERENEDLRASLASVSAHKKEWIPAHFLYTDGGLSIDVGAQDGVEPMAMLLYRGAFVGYVKDVFPATSSVTTVWTPGARFGVQLRPSGASCVASVTLRDERATCMTRVDAVHEGDPIEFVPSNAGDEGGMLFGYIRKDLTQTADPISTFTIKLVTNSPQEVTTLLVRKGGI